MYTTFSHGSIKDAQLMHNSRSCNHLRSVTVFDRKSYTITTPDFLIENTENLFRKFYGKRVSKLTSKGKSPLPCPPNRFKALKTFVAKGYKLTRCPPKSIKRLVICYSGSFKDDKIASHLLRSISQYKYLTELYMGQDSLVFTNEKYLYRQIRKLANLQCFETTLRVDQVNSNAKYLSNMKTPKIIKIRVLEKLMLGRRHGQPEDYQLLLKLLTSKTIQYLKLHFCSTSQDVVANLLLQALSHTCLPSFNIYFKVGDDSNILKSEYLNSALVHVDLLSVCPIIEYSCNTVKNPNIALNQAQRKLTIGLSSLQNVPKVSDDDHPFRYINESFLRIFGLSGCIIPELNNIKSLKRISLELVDISTPAIEDFVKVLKCSSELEQLKIRSFSLKEYKSQDQDIFKSIFTSISKLTNLQSLEFERFTLPPELVDMVTYPVLFLKNLTKLKIEVLSTNSAESGLYFPTGFPETSKLIKIILVLPHLNSESKKNLINGIAKQKQLKKLVILNGSQLLDQEQTRSDLKETLTSLSKLNTVLIGDSNFQKNDAVASSQTKSEISAQLKDFVGSLIQKNLELEKVHLVTKDAYIIFVSSDMPGKWLEPNNLNLNVDWCECIHA